MTTHKIFIFITFIFFGLCFFNNAEAIRVDFLNKSSSVQPPPLNATQNVSGNIKLHNGLIQKDIGLPNSESLKNKDNQNFDKKKIDKQSNAYIGWDIFFVIVILILSLSLYLILRRKMVK